MFLTTVNLQLAQVTGFNTKRGRLRDKLVLRKHDPIVLLIHFKIKSCFC
uniref:Uncharacterized protein n=1 Tax=Sinocyclocheilus anshuiensis TaxID=1608454 RepID=A0A671PLM3_9TELE